MSRLNTTFLSPGKLNLFLHFIGKRQDGYHLLESLFVPLECCDIIELSESDTTSIQFYDVTGKNMDLGSNNTAIRAVHGLQAACNLDKAVAIKVIKQIPIGAGLGGSSTNAGTILSALADLWDLNISPQMLAKLALTLGSDTPYFLNPQPAFITGIGDLREDVQISFNMWTIVVFPGYSISSSDSYNTGLVQFTKPIDKNAIYDAILNGSNGLTASAISLQPMTKILLSEIKAQPGCIVSRMSGSGSACFGLFENEIDAKKAMEFFQNQCYWVHYQKLSL